MWFHEFFHGKCQQFKSISVSEGWFLGSKFVKLLKALVWSVNLYEFLKSNFWRVFFIFGPTVDQGVNGLLPVYSVGNFYLPRPKWMRRHASRTQLLPGQVVLLTAPPGSPLDSAAPPPLLQPPAAAAAGSKLLFVGMNIDFIIFFLRQMKNTSNNKLCCCCSSCWEPALTVLWALGPYFSTACHKNTKYLCMQ